MWTDITYSFLLIGSDPSFLFYPTVYINQTNPILPISFNQSFSFNPNVCQIQPNISRLFQPKPTNANPSLPKPTQANPSHLFQYFPSISQPNSTYNLTHYISFYPTFPLRKRGINLTLSACDWKTRVGCEWSVLRSKRRRVPSCDPVMRLWASVGWKFTFKTNQIKVYKMI